MKRSAILMAFVVLAWLGATAAATAGEGPRPSPTVTAGTDDNVVWGKLDAPGQEGGQRPGASSSSQSVSTLPPGHYETQPVCAQGGAETCGTNAYCIDGTEMMWVWYQTDDGRQLGRGLNCSSPAPGATSAATPAIDPKSELAKVPLPDSTLHFQPLDNRTLVHFRSNYYTEAKPFGTRVQLLNNTATIDFKIRPVEFDWIFGDGTTAKTATPGAAYPHLEITHEYQRTGIFAASVTTTWAADYRVNGGPWAPVSGTVTKTGAAVAITVREATPVLTD